MSLLEQKLLIHSKNMSPPLIFSEVRVAQYLVFLSQVRSLSKDWKYIISLTCISIIDFTGQSHIEVRTAMRDAMIN